MAETQADAGERAKTLIRSGEHGALREMLSGMHAADVAEMLEGLEEGDRVLVLKQLDNRTAADVLAIVDEHSGQALLRLLSDREVVSLLEEMPSDDAVDIISSLPPDKTAQIDALLPSDEREKLRELRGFEEDTAGGIMEVEKVAVQKHATIRDAIELVRKLADEIENVQTVYVVDRSGVLVGGIPVLDLLLHEPHEKVADVMDDKVIAVPVEMDQEEVAAMFGKYDEFALPVVDSQGRLIGRITVDDIIDVMEEEASEDIARIAGTGEEEFGETSPVRISRARLPWLVVSMLGEILNAMIMSRYALTIETYVTQAFFIPLVIGTAGASGMQAAVVVVREIAMGQHSTLRIGRRVFRELQVTFLNGLILGAILFGIVTAWQKAPGLGTLLWISLVTVTAASAFMGASIPLFMNRLRIDPAIATGPFITVTSDIVAMVIYMSFATYYISSIAR